MEIVKDKSGVKLKYPDRTCKECKKYPCIKNMDKLRCDMAKYGCNKYE